MRVNSTIEGVKKNTIYHENCLETMERMPQECVDLVVTSPPYDNMRTYEGYSALEFKKIAHALYNILKKGGVLVWIVGDETIHGNETGTSFEQALYFRNHVGFQLFDTMIYLKPPRGAVGNNKTYWQSFEYMFVLSKGTPKTIHLLYDRENKEVRTGDHGSKRYVDGSLKTMRRGGYLKKGRRTNVWQYNIGKGHSTTDDIAYQHPAIFPEKLAQDHILSWSNTGDIVYDPFMGSGTTAKMCAIHQRYFIGSELNKKYCDIAQKRLNTMGKLL